MNIFALLHFEHENDVMIMIKLSQGYEPQGFNNDHGVTLLLEEKQATRVCLLHPV